MKLVIGLGNPGRKYRSTRHNIGFICLDQYAKIKQLSFKMDKKFQGEIIKEHDFILLKPQTYMNLSGISVRSVVEYFDIAPDDIMIIYDDLDLPTSQLRLRYQGGDGGHKGIRSIMSSLSEDTFKRLRFGIGNHPDIDAKDYVLSTFHKVEISNVENAVITTLSIIDDFIKGKDFIQIMNQYN